MRAAHQLHGERHAPELPIPATAIWTYADRFGLSGTFVSLVQAYDHAVIGGMNRSMKEMVGKNGTSGNAS